MYVTIPGAFNLLAALPSLTDEELRMLAQRVADEQATRNPVITLDPAETLLAQHGHRILAIKMVRERYSRGGTQISLRAALNAVDAARTRHEERSDD